MKKIIFVLLIAITYSCVNREEKKEMKLDKSGMNAEFSSLKKLGFVSSWDLSDDDTRLTIKVIDADWENATVIDQKKLTRRFFDIYLSFINKGLILDVKSNDGSILLAKDAMSKVRNNENPELIK